MNFFNVQMLYPAAAGAGVVSRKSSHFGNFFLTFPLSPLQHQHAHSRYQTLNFYREKYPEASGALSAWKGLMECRNFQHFPDLKSAFGSADLIKDDKVVFNIMGNNYRLVAGVDFRRNVVFVKWFGTHKEYDKIKPAEVVYADPSNKD